MSSEGKKADVRLKVRSASPKRKAREKSPRKSPRSPGQKSPGKSPRKSPHRKNTNILVDRFKPDKDQKKSKYKLKIRKSQIVHPQEVTESVIKITAAIFKKFDADRNGTISKGEFQQALGKIYNISHEQACDKTRLLMRDIHDEGFHHSRQSLENIDFNEFLNAVAESRTAKKGDKAYEIKEMVEKAAWYYGATKFVAKFYHPHKYDEYTENYKCCPPPIFIPLVSLFQLGVFIYFVEVHNGCGEDGLGDMSKQCPEVFDSMWAYQYTSAYYNEWWRFITYMFLHASGVHIATNLFLQLIVGVPLEMVHSWRVIVLYFIGGIAGSLAVSIFDERTDVVGASAGCYTLVGAHVANIFNYYSIMPFVWPRIFIFFTIFAIDIAISAYQKYEVGNTSISYTAHLAGALTGILLGAIMLDELPHHEGKWWKIIKNYGGMLIIVAVCVS
mmetsp:Transcript_16642/g.29849  ORF Transcript_16642/g.29849 Transcript_16642/m.29849 type:complete len:444 (+) Transcript_16642:81-1412(+)